MDIRVFLAHAVKLELAAEEAYLRLIDDMTARGNEEAAGFFREMARFSRLHLETAKRRAGFDDATDIHGIVDSWPGGINEIPVDNSRGAFTLEDAMQLALAAEKRAVTFYDAVAQVTTNPQIRHLAEEFADEEREHVLALERLIESESFSSDS